LTEFIFLDGSEVGEGTRRERRFCTDCHQVIKLVVACS